MTTFELRPQLRRNWACPLLVLTTGACAAPVDATRHTPEERTPSNLACSDCAPCAAKPVAWLIGRDELAESALESRLSDAGFVPERLPLDRSPAELRGLLFIGSGASSREDYRDYMQQYASHLHDFVDRANTLQMSQHHGDETLPPFLPTTHSVKRAKDPTRNSNSSSTEALRGTCGIPEVRRGKRAPHSDSLETFLGRDARPQPVQLG